MGFVHIGGCMVKVSVIIPCYNVELYISDCLDSVLAQTLQEIEVICIDDGSTDGTLNILEEYGSQYKNLDILSQKNQGSGIARNRGICAARGEYLAFMDADDFYPAQNTMEKMYDTAKREKAEICGGSGCTFRNGIYTYTGLRKGFTFLEDGWIDKRDYPIILGYWRFIYKSKFIRENNIFFPDYLRCQDPPFFLSAVVCAGRLYCMRELTYVYRKEHKQVFFTPRKAIDYAKGMRDSLAIAKTGDLLAIQRLILNELHGELSAVMYLYAEKYDEMNLIIHQFNEMISDSDMKCGEDWRLKEGEEIAPYIRNVRNEMGDLLEQLKMEETVLIYGAGTVGKRVKAFLEENGISLEAFVVSDTRQNADSLDGLQIRCIDDYVDRKDNCMVIIATFPYLHEEIRNTLWEKEFKRVHTISMEKLHLFSGKVIH